MKKLFLTSAITLTVTIATNATIWRVNNTNGVDADFTTITSAIGSASVLNGDTLHIEPSSTSYGSFTLTKRLILIGNGYFLGGTNGNAGLQANENTSEFSIITLSTGSNGSKFLGLEFNRFTFANVAGLGDYLVENCHLEYGILGLPNNQTITDVTFSKCAISRYLDFSNTNATLHNFTIENCIYYSSTAYSMDMLANTASTNLVFRNNTLNSHRFSNITGFYVANNIFLRNAASTFNSCVVKNNLFVFNQTGITIGPLSTNGNNLVSQTRASLIVDTGSEDGKFQLAVGSPAIGGGVDIGSTKPDCGAFGGNDPYVLSGIPAVPSIYSFSFPNSNSVPLNSPSILVDFSTRDNK